MFSQCSSQSVLDAGVTGIGNWRALDIGANSPRQRVAILVRNGPLRHHKHTLTPPKSKSVWGPFLKTSKISKGRVCPILFKWTSIVFTEARSLYFFFQIRRVTHKNDLQFFCATPWLTILRRNENFPPKLRVKILLFLVISRHTERFFNWNPCAKKVPNQQ